MEELNTENTYIVTVIEKHEITSERKFSVRANSKTEAATKVKAGSGYLLEYKQKGFVELSKTIPINKIKKIDYGKIEE